MRNLCKLFLALALAGFCAEAAVAQYTTVTAASGAISMGGTPIATGTAIFYSVDTSGHPQPYTLAGGGLNVPDANGTAAACTITAGTLGACNVPNAATTSPAGLIYNIAIADTSSGNPTSGQAFILKQVHNVSGTTWQLDHYSPMATVSTLPAFSYTQGVGAPSGVGGTNALYADITIPTSPVLYTWTGSAWALLGGGGAVTYGTTAGTSAQGNDSRFAANAAAAAAAQATANAAATPASVAAAITTAVPQAVRPFAVDAEWPFNDGSGTTIADISGNGHNATFGTGANAPTWVPYGVNFNATGDGWGGAQVATTNIAAFKSVIIAHCVYPEIQTTGTGGNVPYSQSGTIFGSSTNDGINFGGGQSSGGGQYFGAFRPNTISVNPFGVKAAAFSGWGQCQTSALTIGASDAFYQNGQPVTLAQSGSSAASIASSGGYEFGGGGYGGVNSYRGTITYALLSVNTVWTAAQVQQLNTYIQAKLAARNMPVYPSFNQALSNQIIFTGDSIFAGHGASGIWTSLLTLNNTYTVTNWAVAGMNAWDLGRLAESRWYSQVAPSAARNIIISDGGTNDLVNGFSAAATWASIALEAKKALAVGAIPVASTLISRNGQDAAQAPLNVLIRAGWKQAGFAALLDVAELPPFAAGGYSSPTYYQGDGTHPNGGTVCTATNGGGELCFYTSKLINTLDGSSAANPDTTASNAFVAADANNYVIQTPTAAATYQLVNCAAITGQTKTIVNGSTGFAIAVSPTSPDTIVGATSIPAGGSLTYTATVASPTAGGCYWAAR